MKEMLHRALCLLAAALLPLSLAGCWDNRELQSLAIITGVAVDAAPQGDAIVLTVQLGQSAQSPSIAGQSSGSSPLGVTLQATGRTILDTLQQMENQTSRELYMQHNQVIIFGRTLAEQGIGSYLDYYVRAQGSRISVWVLVADGEGGQLLSAQPEPDKVSALTLDDMMDKQEHIADALGTNLLEYISAMLDKTSSPVVPIVKASQEGDRLELTGLAVLKDNRMVGRLEGELIQGYCWVMGIVKENALEVSVDDCEASALANKGTSCKIEPVLNPDGSVSLALRIQGAFSLNEMSSCGSKPIEDMIPLMEQAIGREIERQITASFEWSQGLNADIFGVGAAMHRRYPRQWPDLQQRWGQIYPDIQLSVETDITLTDTGKIGNALILGE